MKSILTVLTPSTKRFTYVAVLKLKSLHHFCFKGILLLLLLGIQVGQAQTLEELYEQGDFPALIKYADKADELTKEELYWVGYAFFQLEQDVKAIEMYDKAIEKGLDEDYIYLFKGLALRYNNQNEEAFPFFQKAVEKNPESQKNQNELGNYYYFQSQYDSALVYFKRARELPYEFGDPYLKIPNIYHIQQDFEKALEEYRISASLIDPADPTYLELLLEIGILEYAVFKQYDKAIAAYKEVLEFMPDNYDFYPKLIKAYYGNEEFEKGDSLISVMKAQYEKGNLSEDYQKYGTIAIAEFEWNGQKLAVYKYFEEPKETLDLMYKVYLLSKDGQSIERTFMTEKTIQIGKDGAKHLFCEKERSGMHHTYPFGWSTDTIEFNSLKKVVIAVLNDEIRPSASSNFGVPKGKPSSKEKKKKKKKKN